MTVEPIAVDEVDVLPQRSLLDHEQVIQRHLNSFLEVANSLLAIKADRLYRDAGHDTFQDYCQNRWQMSARRANQLIVGATIVDGLAHDLSETGTMVPIPEVERQARALAAVPAAERADVWRAAVSAAGGEQPTTGQVQAAVDAHLGKSYPAQQPERAEDRGAGEADDREAPGHVEPSGTCPSESADGAWNSPAPEPAQHEDKGAADECPPPAAPLPPRLSVEEQAELDHAEAINRRRKNLAAIHSNWATFESLRTNPDRAEILRGLVDHDRQFILDLERRVSWKA